MRKLLFLTGVLFCMHVLQAQTFSVTHTDTIPDNNTTVVFNVAVSGLPAVIDTNFGLELACINMFHTYDSDMNVELQAPDGTTVLLFSGVGGGGHDFNNTCLAGTGTSITQGSPPFTGTFQSQGTLGNVNNGQNPNGVWHLRCRDMAGADFGILTFWSITFGGNPAQPFGLTSSNLPIVKLTTMGSPIIDDPKVPVMMQIIDRGPGLRNYVNDTNYAYEGVILAELQGFTGPFYPKKNYDFETIDALGQKQDTSILGMPTEHDWMFKAEYLDHSLIKNMITYTLAERMGRYAPRTRMCEMFLDGNYIGYYTLTEKVKRDANRVDIAKLTTNDVSGQDLTGGYIIEMNINGDPGAWNSAYPAINVGTSNLPVEFKYVYPSASNILNVQGNYIHEYVDSFEDALNGPSFADPVNGYRKFVDIKTFIDFLIVNEYSVNYDSYGRSTFMYKEKVTDGGKLKIGPPWDYDRALDYNYPGLTNGWVWQITHQGWPFPFWWSKWWTEADYRKQLACRWSMLRQEVLSDANVNILIDSLSTRIHEAAERNFTVWNDLNGQTYDQQIDSVRSFLNRRLDWMDAELAQENVAPPLVYLPTDTVVCAGTVYDASFNGAQYSYNWQPGPDTSFITLVQSGVQTLQVSDRYGCYTRKQMDVTISQPDASFSGTQLGTSLLWNFAATDQNATSYNWTFGDGGTATLASPSHTYASDGSYLVELSMTDSIGCLATQSDTIQFTFVGMEELAGLNGGVYPNPFHDRLEIALDAPSKVAVELRLENELGQVVRMQAYKAGTQHITLATGDLPAGIYFLRATAGERTAVRKLVKY